VKLKPRSVEFLYFVYVAFDGLCAPMCNNRSTNVVSKSRSENEAKHIHVSIALSENVAHALYHTETHTVGNVCESLSNFRSCYNEGIVWPGGGGGGLPVYFLRRIFFSVPAMTVLQRTRYSIRKFSVVYNAFVSLSMHFIPDSSFIKL